MTISHHRRLPPPPMVDTIHHAGLLGRDLGALAATYERLGFTLTPISMPSVPLRPNEAPVELGVGNRCAVFGSNYLELLGVVDLDVWRAVPVELRGPFDIDPPLRVMRGCMFFTSDPTSSTRPAGVPGRRVSNRRRSAHSRGMIDTSRGAVQMRARSFSVRPDAAPEALLQYAQHLTPEHVFQERWQRHANGAVALSAVTLRAADPAAAAMRYARLMGVEPIAAHDALELRCLGRASASSTGGRECQRMGRALFLREIS